MSSSLALSACWCRGPSMNIVTERRKKHVSGSNAQANQGWLSKHGQTWWFWGREETEERKKCNKESSSLDTTGENKQKLKEGWGGLMKSREGGLYLLREAQSKVWGWEERQWWMWQEELRGWMNTSFSQECWMGCNIATCASCCC